MVGRGPVNQEIYDSLLLLQHRGQDSTGMATAEPSGTFHVHKAKGLTPKDVTGESGRHHCKLE